MEERRIPPLLPDANYGESQLVHVTAVIRHGARVPWSGDIQCWANYTETWNCDKSTLTTAGMLEPHKTAPLLLLDKRYNALKDSEDNLQNSLQGSCQEGQMIAQGVAQQVTNGDILRAAYWDTEHRQQRLWEDEDKPWETVYYRSDDEERTVASGQTLLSSMFSDELDDLSHAPRIAVHTADYWRDIVAPNEGLCPRLTELRERAMGSEEYRQFNTSIESRVLRNFLANELDMPWRGAGIDCLMTTMCTDRDLPPQIDDFQEGDENTKYFPKDDMDYGTNLFSRIYNFFVTSYAIMAKHDNAAFSKLAMAPLWTEILDNVNGALIGQEQLCCPVRKTPKLALFSGHDTTLIPLLASIGVYDESWPPYASMMVLEIHQINIDNRKNKDLYLTNNGFRLIYNGEVLTHKVAGCPPETDICDFSMLAVLLDEFATLDRDCARKYPVIETETNTVTQAGKVLSTKLGLAAFLAVIMISAGVGAAGTIFVLRSNKSLLLERRKYRVPDEQHDGVFNGNGHYRDESNSENDFTIE